MGLSTRPPTKQAATMATITFKCEEKDDKLEVVVLSCKGLPDLDGAFNLTDAYVVVKIGAGKDKHTFSPDDIIGKASIKLSKLKDKMGKPVTLEMVSPSDGETHLSDGQTTAIYNLFRTL